MKKPTPEELKRAALILRAAGPRNRHGIGGRPKTEEPCPMGCGLLGGFTSLAAHIPHCPRNVAKDGGRALTIRAWLKSRRARRLRTARRAVNL